VTGDHLTDEARAAHGRMLVAFDRLMDGVLRREGPAAAKLPRVRDRAFPPSWVLSQFEFTILG